MIAVYRSKSPLRHLLLLLLFLLLLPLLLPLLLHFTGHSYATFSLPSALWLLPHHRQRADPRGSEAEAVRCLLRFYLVRFKVLPTNQLPASLER